MNQTYRCDYKLNNRFENKIVPELMIKCVVHKILNTLENETI